jgi:hypothetical protein
MTPFGRSEVQRPSPEEAPAFAFRLAGQKNREWPSDVAVELMDGGHRWAWMLAKHDVATVQRGYVPPGTYKLTVRAPHHRPLVYPRCVSPNARRATSAC